MNHAFESEWLSGSGVQFVCGARLAALIYTVNCENLFCPINANCQNLHDGWGLLCLVEVMPLLLWHIGAVRVHPIIPSGKYREKIKNEFSSIRGSYYYACIIQNSKRIRPLLVLTEMPPPWASIMDLVMASPSPAPSLFP